MNTFQNTVITVVVLGMVYFLFSTQMNTVQHFMQKQPNREAVEASLDHAVPRSSAVDSTLKWLLPQNTSEYLCSDVSAIHPQYSEQYNKRKADFVSSLRKNKVHIKEGHSGMEAHEGQYGFYHHIVQEPWVKTVCEIGFNAGHSAFQWLASSNENTKLYSFDICRFDYTKPMAEYMEQAFPGRFKLYCGPSQKTLPMMRELINMCNVVVVDGNHTLTAAYDDLVNFNKLAHPEDHIIILDDCPGMAEVEQAWQKMKKSHMVRELFRCVMKLQQRRIPGITVGKYV